MITGEPVRLTPAPTHPGESKVAGMSSEPAARWMSPPVCLVLMGTQCRRGRFMQPPMQPPMQPHATAPVTVTVGGTVLTIAGLRIQVNEY